MYSDNSSKFNKENFEFDSLYMLLQNLLQVAKMGTQSCWTIDQRFMLKGNGNLFALNALTTFKQINFVQYQDTKKEGYWTRIKTLHILNRQSITSHATQTKLGRILDVQKFVEHHDSTNNIVWQEKLLFVQSVSEASKIRLHLAKSNSFSQ